jgi:hypothetical protein
MDAATNLQNMKKLDDSWNAQDLQTFRKYHAKDCIVRWPNQPPTLGLDGPFGDGVLQFELAIAPVQKEAAGTTNAGVMQIEWVEALRSNGLLGNQQSISCCFGETSMDATTFAAQRSCREIRQHTQALLRC